MNRDFFFWTLTLLEPWMNRPRNRIVDFVLQQHITDPNVKNDRQQHHQLQLLDESQVSSTGSSLVYYNHGTIEGQLFQPEVLVVHSAPAVNHPRHATGDKGGVNDRRHARRVHQRTNTIAHSISACRSGTGNAAIAKQHGADLPPSGQSSASPELSPSACPGRVICASIHFPTGFRGESSTRVDSNRLATAGESERVILLIHPL
jgi:hypothetical protein